MKADRLCPRPCGLKRTFYKFSSPRAKFIRDIQPINPFIKAALQPWAILSISPRADCMATIAPARPTEQSPLGNFADADVYQKGRSILIRAGSDESFTDPSGRQSVPLSAPHLLLFLKSSAPRLQSSRLQSPCARYIGCTSLGSRSTG